MKRNLIFQVLVTLLLSACSVTDIMTPMPEYTLDDKYAWFRRPLRVVVFPFSHATGAPGSGIRISEAVSSKLGEVENFRHMPPHETAERLKLNPVMPVAISLSRALQMGNQLEADLVIIGAVTDYHIYGPSGSAKSAGQVWRGVDFDRNGRIEQHEGYMETDSDAPQMVGTACVLGAELMIADVATKAIVYSARYACSADTFLEGEKTLVRVLLRPLWDHLRLHQ